MLRRILVSAAVAAASISAAQPVGAAPEADVTLACAESGSVALPSGPPAPSGQITVLVHGQTTVTNDVPGPCQAPGWLSRKS
jgi:hypothetical protein